jgi:hypothetical protein
MVLTIRLWVYRVKEATPRKLAWMLPKKVVMWAFYRVMAHATTGKYGNTFVIELTGMDAIDRYIKDKEL